MSNVQPIKSEISLEIINNDKNWLKITAALDSVKMAREQAEKSRKQIRYLQEIISVEENNLDKVKRELKAAEYGNDAKTISRLEAKVSDRQARVLGLEKELQDLGVPEKEASRQLAEITKEVNLNVPRVKVADVLKAISPVIPFLRNAIAMLDYDERICSANKEAGLAVEGDWGNGPQRNFKGEIKGIVSSYFSLARQYALEEELGVDG